MNVADNRTAIVPAQDPARTRSSPGAPAPARTDGWIALALAAAWLLLPDAVPSWAARIPLHPLWSSGLTLSNFILLPLALLAGTYWTLRYGWSWLKALGRPPLRGWLIFFAWAVLDWALLLVLGRPTPTGTMALVALHVLKLTLMPAVAALWAAMLAAGGVTSRRLTALLLAAVAANAGMGVLQAFGWLPVNGPLAVLAAGHWRASGAFYDANMYGVLLALPLGVFTVAAAHRRRQANFRITASGVALAGVIGLIVLNLVLCASRAGFLAAAVTFLALMGRRHGRAAAEIAALALTVALLFPSYAWRRIDASLGTLAESGAFDPADAAHGDGGTRARETSMAAALPLLKRRPWLGLGFGRALYAGVALDDVGGAVDLGRGPSNAFRSRFTGAQNVFLTVLVETGPLGLLLLAGALASLLRVLAAAGDIADGLLAGTLGMIAASFTIEIFLNARILAIVLAIGASCRRRADA